MKDENEREKTISMGVRLFRSEIDKLTKKETDKLSVSQGIREMIAENKLLKAQLETAKLKLKVQELETALDD
jgi:hypothetical protein